MDLANLAEYWQVIDAEFDAIDRLPSLTATHTLSARAFDEAQVAGHRPYIEATRYLGVARDNHDALLAVLEHHGATVWAPWSMLRPTFESSFLAAWVLDPDDGRERRARGLRCEILDMYEQKRHRAAFKAIPELRDAIEEHERKLNETSITTYKTEAVALGRSFENLRQKVNVVDELKKLSFVDVPHMGVFLEGTWRLLSGYEHGLGWASMRGSDGTVRATVPGGADMMLVINDDEFVNAAKSTYLLLIAACRLLRQRHTRPQGELDETDSTPFSRPRSTTRSPALTSRGQRSGRAAVTEFFSTTEDAGCGGTRLVEGGYARLDLPQMVRGSADVRTCDPPGRRARVAV